MNDISPSVPEVIAGDIFSDERGKIAHVNGFRFGKIKRFYIIEHPDTAVIRAWQGHRIEQKWFYVVKGSFCVAWVKIDDWEHPSDTLQAEHQILRENDSKILHIPNEYANGLKALEAGSKILVFSDMEVEASIQHKFRYDKYQWFRWEEVTA